MWLINVKEFGTKPEVGIFRHPSKKSEVIAGGICPEKSMETNVKHFMAQKRKRIGMIMLHIPYNHTGIAMQHNLYIHTSIAMLHILYNHTGIAMLHNLYTHTVIAMLYTLYNHTGIAMLHNLYYRP